MIRVVHRADLAELEAKASALPLCQNNLAKRTAELATANTEIARLQARLDDTELRNKAEQAAAEIARDIHEKTRNLLSTAREVATNATLRVRNLERELHQLRTQTPLADPDTTHPSLDERLTVANEPTPAAPAGVGPRVAALSTAHSLTVTRSGETPA